jgi:hypothetical protein
MNTMTANDHLEAIAFLNDLLDHTAPDNDKITVIVVGQFDHHYTVIPRQTALQLRENLKLASRAAGAKPTRSSRAAGARPSR